MADTPSPWSVKGVDPEAREAAKIAARKAGMTVGAWLTQMSRQSAAEQLRRPRPGQPQPERPPEYPDPMASGPYGGAPGYGQNAAPPPPPPPPGGAPPPAPTIQAIFDSIQRLASRIEQSEQRTAETIAPIDSASPPRRSSERRSKPGAGETGAVMAASFVWSVTGRSRALTAGSGPLSCRAGRSGRCRVRAHRRAPRSAGIRPR